MNFFIIIFIITINPIFSSDFKEPNFHTLITSDITFSSKEFFSEIKNFIERIDNSDLIDLKDFDLFRGHDVIVRANIYSDSPSPEKVWICFDPILGYKWANLKYGSTQYYDSLSSIWNWGHEYFEKRKINHINIYPTNNMWWQTWEMEPAIEIIQRLKEKYRFRELITYGLSHGGMGAILFSDRLMASACLAFSPAGFRFEDVSLKLFRKSQIALNGLVKIYGSAILNKRCNYVIYYPSDEMIDAQIAESAMQYVDEESIDHLFLYKIKTADHCFVCKLQGLGLLNPIVQAVHHGNTSELARIYNDVKDLDLDAQLVEAVLLEPAPPNLDHISYDVEELRMLVYHLLQEKESLSHQLAAVRK